MKVIKTDKYTIYNADCFDVLPELADNSIDLTLGDLPYGETTNNPWDIRLPMNDYVLIDGVKFSKDEFMVANYKNNIDYEDALENWQALRRHGMWHYLNKINKKSAATILTASGKFVGYLQNSNPKNFKYMCTWIKNNRSNVQNAKIQPIRITEQVLVFCRQPTIYNPQGLERIDKVVKNSVTAGGSNVKSGYLQQPRTYVQKYSKYPNDVYEGYKIEERGHHPTQKSVAMMRDIILTYTNHKNENGGQSVVFDPCMGSGSTGLGAMSCEPPRYFIGIEKDKKMFNTALKRLRKAEPISWQAGMSIDNQLKLL